MRCQRGRLQAPRRPLRYDMCPFHSRVPLQSWLRIAELKLIYILLCLNRPACHLSCLLYISLSLFEHVKSVFFSGDGERLIMKGANLTTPEMLFALSSRCKAKELEAEKKVKKKGA
uniref:Uncharacterized protein n=1 Tax=Crocodylus porosus TaxID=8502 RepID=A0A7M4FPB3_CROPO